MAKDPAFLFYPNDYIGGTMGMTFEEKGAYMELLMLQFNRGHMTSHMIGQTVGQLWVNIKDKFIQDANGLYYNERLEEEQNKRKLFTDSRRNNKKGKNQYTKKRGHMSSHMENENENVNINSSLKGGVGEKFDFSSIESEQWFMSVLSFLSMKIDYKKLIEYWEQYKKAMIADDDLYRDKMSYKSHFRHWTKKQIENTNGFASKIQQTENAFENV